MGLGELREGLLALAVRTGLQVMTSIMEEDVTAQCGPRGKHDPQRVATRHGHGAGTATLSLVDGSRETPVASFEAPARVLVDGSLVEIFDAGPAPFTTRAYPTATSGWIVRMSGAAAVRAWRLGLPR